jgi:hypothetical protein
MRRGLFGASLLVAALAWLPAVALGQGAEDPAITLGVERSSLPELPDRVTARLSGVGGEPISGAVIDFWIEVEILGARRARLGSATTDATGVARVPIVPRHSEYEIRASFDGNELFPAAEATSRLMFPEERVEPVEVVAPPSPLTTLRVVMPRAMGIVVALLWTFFAIAVTYVIKTIHGHGNPPSRRLEGE